MLKNIKIATQVAGSFGLVILMLILLGTFFWTRLDHLEDVSIKEAEANTQLVIASEIATDVALAGQAVLRFMTESTPELGDRVIVAMDNTRQKAAQLAATGSGNARDLVALKNRHEAEAQALIERRLEHARLQEELAAIGVQSRRALGALKDALARRSAGEEAYLALSASEGFLVSRIRVDRFIAGGTSEDFDSARPQHEMAQQAINRLGGMTLNQAERAQLEEAAGGVAAFWPLAEQLRDVELDVRAALQRLDETTAEVKALVAVIQEEERRTAFDLDEQAASIMHGTTLSILAGVLVAIVLGAAIAAGIALPLSRRLSRSADQTERLAHGDLSVEIDGAEGSNELAKMARALEVFKQNEIERLRLAEAARIAEDEQSARREDEMRRQARVVRDIGDGLNRLAKGDLTHSIASPATDPFPAEYDSLREAYNSVLHSLSGTLGRIADVADQVRNGSAEISSAAQDLSGRAEAQAATLEQSAAALNELNESVRSTAERARSAEHVSRENRSIAESGVTVVQDAVVAMKGIEKSSEQITRIIGVIDDIAFQTNLLALNAGVEAARAGEAGRGFAVVASEVRGLAQRASESAREIKSLISESAAQVQTGSALVGRTGASLAQILSKAQEVSEQITAIAAAAQEQSIGLGEINTGVNQLDQVTQQNAAVAEETNAAAAALQQQSHDLLQEIAGFQTGSARAPRTQLVARHALASPAADAKPLRVAAGSSRSLAEF